MSVSEPKPRRPRRDALRNRDEILRWAQLRFAETGIGSSLDGIAKDAGVGPGTLYRHFPTRDDLLAALLQARDEEFAVRQAEIEQMTDTGAALREWMLALEEYFGAFDGLPEPLSAALTEEHSPLANTCVGFIDVTDRFLQAAQADGKAQPWVKGRELFLAALALTWVKGAQTADGESLKTLRNVIENGYLTTPAAGTSPAARAAQSPAE